MISSSSCACAPHPPRAVYEGVFFEDFAAGVQALRALGAEHALPDVARLSDEQETRMSLALAGTGGLKGRLGRAYLGARGYGEGCLAIFGFEGTREEVAFRRSRALELARGCGALRVGRSPGQAWLHGRFDGPLPARRPADARRDGGDARDRHPVVELHALKQRVQRAIAAALEQHGTPGLVMCHVSHVYETGASLYFTFLARQHEQRPARDSGARSSRPPASAILDGGGTITHHHAVGRDHLPWIERELGAGGVEALRAVKQRAGPQRDHEPGQAAAGSQPARLKRRAGRRGPGWWDARWTRG